MNDKTDDIYDIAVIGGGVNGCGVARDAAGRGRRVFLCEMNDLASGTSSWSTKLIHGGLRYLEYYEFRLVRESLLERETLWAIAPQLIEPLRFVLPYHAGLRPAWMLRAGLFLYDYIGGRKRLPPTRRLDLAHDAAGRPLKPGLFRFGFEYSDCRVDDTRLVALNAVDARDKGATIRTRAKAVAARQASGVWELDVERAGEGRETIRARTLVNAGGPWVADVLKGCMRLQSSARVRLVQGSHIVTRRLYEHDRCYIFQNADGRIVFAIPYFGAFTLIGTTDRDYQGDPGAARATPEEVEYLCRAASEYFARPVTSADVVWSFSGVRPLYDDGASDAKAATRDYVLEVDAPPGGPPALSIFGGKITTYRRLAGEALEKLDRFLPPATGRPAGWTAKEPLPGGDFPIDGRAALADALRREHLFLTPEWAMRLVCAYGTRARALLGDAQRAEDLGQVYGATLTEAEVAWLIAQEWAETAEDVLWRRSKLGLFLTPDEAARVAARMPGGAGATITPRA